MQPVAKKNISNNIKRTRANVSASVSINSIRVAWNEIMHASTVTVAVASSHRNKQWMFACVCVCTNQRTGTLYSVIKVFSSLFSRWFPFPMRKNIAKILCHKQKLSEYYMHTIKWRNEEKRNEMQKMKIEPISGKIILQLQIVSVIQLVSCENIVCVILFVRVDLDWIG